MSELGDKIIDALELARVLLRQDLATLNPNHAYDGNKIRMCLAKIDAALSAHPDYVLDLGEYPAALRKRS